MYLFYHTWKKIDSILIYVKNNWKIITNFGKPKGQKHPVGSLVYVNKSIILVTIPQEFTHQTLAVLPKSQSSVSSSQKSNAINSTRQVVHHPLSPSRLTHFYSFLNWLVLTACFWTVPRAPQISCVSLYLLMSPFFSSSWLHFPAILLKTLLFKPSGIWCCLLLLKKQPLTGKVERLEFEKMWDSWIVWVD